MRKIIITLAIALLATPALAGNYPHPDKGSCTGCTVVEGESHPDRRTRTKDFSYERRWQGDKNRGDVAGKPREYHRNHNRTRRSRNR